MTRAEYKTAHRAERVAYVRRIDRPTPADMTPVCRLWVFGRDDGADDGRVVADIIEASMTAEQFQRHFMGRGMLARTYGAGEYSLQAGVYVDGHAFFPCDPAVRNTVSRF